MSQSKHLKQSFNLETANRINELPDKLLCHILGFLPTRCAVATSILSKRWMYVWNDIPVLDFMDLPSSMTSSDINFNEIQYVRFKNFVNRVLLLNGSPCLERVHFEAYKGFPPVYVYEWMLVIARRCVLELCVIAKHFSVKIPSNFLVDKEKLTVLKLEGPFELDMLASFDLPCLEILSLSEVVFLNKDDPLSSILSSSKVLKELNIDRCEGLKEISVCSSSLKTLRIVSLNFEEAILIKTPILKVLHLSIRRILQSVVNELCSLVEARLHIWTSSVRWIKLLQKICYTKTLVLHSIILDGSNYHNQLPVFQNLTCLEVGFTSWSIVLQILRYAPHLQCLIIHKLMHDWPDINKIKRNGLSLEKIEYYGFDVEVGFEVVRYFLSNSALLNEFKIHTRPWLDAMAENEILKMLLTLPRASNQCEIIIVGNDNACMSEDSDSELDELDWSESDDETGSDT